VSVDDRIQLYQKKEREKNYLYISHTKVERIKQTVKRKREEEEEGTAWQ
jgi:hypothetical protein